MMSSHKLPPKQQYDYFLVMDFEATCAGEGRRMPVSEIIEFPALLVDTKKLSLVMESNDPSLAIKSTFHRFVKPSAYPELTPFCIQLTGITQDTVNASHTFPIVWRQFLTWIKDMEIADSNGNPTSSVLPITCGNWDLSTCLPDECFRHKLILPTLLHAWCDVKQSFFHVFKSWPTGGLMGMMRNCDIPHQGRHHSGLDDCKNLINLVTYLAEEKRHTFKLTNRWKGGR